jgi:tetratricopeptide (TPR) repeat protein
MSKYLFHAIVVLAAISGCGRLLASTPDAADCWNPKAEPKAAIASCTLAIGSAGSNKDLLAMTYENRALAYMHINAFDEALKDCEAAIALRPEDSRAFVCRGIMHGELNKLDLAVADFNHALRLNPNDVDALKNQAHAYELKNDFASASANYAILIRLQPTNFEPWNGQCWARAVIGKQLDAALSDCNEALRLNPKDANSYNTRGLVHFRKKQYTEAIRDYNAAIAINATDFGSSYYTRGLAKLAMGDASGSADVAKGKSIEPGIAQRFAGYGVSAAR